jgi:hypothetical protein
MSDRINYGRRMHRALQGLMADVLDQVAEEGLPGDHHFFITFDTTHPDAEMPDWLRERYPGEITIVIQHWFEDLDVRTDGFGITLNFGDSPVRLFVPMDAVQTFVDPSVEFGLRFDRHDSSDDTVPPSRGPALVSEDADPLDDDASAAQAPSEPPQRDADVVQLDKFRK